MLWNTKQNVTELLLTQCKQSKKPLQNSLTSFAKQMAWRSHEYLRVKAVCMSLDFLCNNSTVESCRKLGWKEKAKLMVEERGKQRCWAEWDCQGFQIISCAGNVRKKNSKPMWPSPTPLFIETGEEVKRFFKQLQGT